MESVFFIDSTLIQHLKGEMTDASPANLLCRRDEGGPEDVDLPARTLGSSKH